MAVFTHGNYNCACSRDVCDWTCTTYATMMSGIVPNTASQPFNNRSKPFKSNADRIRSMTDEELAYFIAEPSVAPPPWCTEIPVCPHMDEDIVPCHECALDWLRQEATT